MDVDPLSSRRAGLKYRKLITKTAVLFVLIFPGGVVLMRVSRQIVRRGNTANLA